MPSRKSPISTINTTRCFFPLFSASLLSAARTDSSVFRLTSTYSITSEISLIAGERSNQISGSPQHPERILFIFSNRDSPNANAPPLSIACPISGIPQLTLVTPTTLIPFCLQRSTMILVLCSSFFK